MKPTRTFSPAEQFDVGIAIGITPSQMLANVESHIRSIADAMVAECLRCPYPEYAEKFLRSQAEELICARATRAYVLGRLLAPRHRLSDRHNQLVGDRTMTEHTPGPWAVSSHHGRLTVATHDGSMIIADCRVASDDEFQANARLIAAAPEMLAALRYAVDVIEEAAGGRESQLSSDEQAALAQARAAIAKANGAET